MKKMSSLTATTLFYKFIQRFSQTSCVTSNLLSNGSLIGQSSKSLFQFSSRKLLNVSAITATNKIQSMRYVSTTIEPTTTANTNTASKEEVHAPPLTKDTAHTLVLRLTSEERTTLLTTLQQFEAEQIKAQYKGELAAFRWRSKFGRPSKVPRLGDVDPTGSYCPVPEDWLLRKYAETVPKPTNGQLLGVAIHNAVPFIGFGFLDNFFMIVCGDYIEQGVGTYMVISTMAAAALGNTLSDVLGLGCAAYVEMFAAKLGVKAPPLSPIQLNMKSSRFSANMGRSIGVCIGCILGMTPLLVLAKKSDDPPATDESKIIIAAAPA